MKLRHRISLLAGAVLLLVLLICAGTLLPALFPFFIVSALLNALGLPRLLSRAAGGLTERLFGLPGAAAGPSRREELCSAPGPPAGHMTGLARRRRALTVLPAGGAAAGAGGAREERSRRAIAVAEEMTAAYRSALVGSTVEVLFEEPSEGFFTGHAPNYVRVYAEGENLHNELRRVRITGIHEDGLLGEIVES